MAKTKCEMLCELLSMCYTISTKSKAEVFFDYSPHVNGISIYYYLEGWDAASNVEATYLTMNIGGNKISRGNLKRVHDELAKLAKDLGVEL